MLNIDTRTADKKTTYSTFCRAIAIRAVHPHSPRLDWLWRGARDSIRSCVM
jgi:hypothetical protein